VVFAPEVLCLDGTVKATAMKINFKNVGNFIAVFFPKTVKNYDVECFQLIVNTSVVITLEQWQATCSIILFLGK